MALSTSPQLQNATRHGHSQDSDDLFLSSTFLTFINNICACFPVLIERVTVNNVIIAQTCWIIWRDASMEIHSTVELIGNIDWHCFHLYKTSLTIVSGFLDPILTILYVSAFLTPDRNDHWMDRKETSGTVNKYNSHWHGPWVQAKPIPKKKSHDYLLISQTRKTYQNKTLCSISQKRYAWIKEVDTSTLTDQSLTVAPQGLAPLDLEGDEFVETFEVQSVGSRTWRILFISNCVYLNLEHYLYGKQNVMHDYLSEIENIFLRKVTFGYRSAEHDFDDKQD
jgi:hypothetical protein